jgi:ligand-binding sensor domain-containing protein
MRIRLLLWIMLCPVLMRGGFDPRRWDLRNVHLRDGLSQVVVTDMVVDAQGFLWAGTFDGLNRFDGTGCRVFRAAGRGDTTGLPSSVIERITADAFHHLYIRTQGGFAVFDSRTAKVIHPRSLKNHKPLWVSRHGGDALWLYTEKGELLLLGSEKLELRRGPVRPFAGDGFCRLIDMTEVQGKLYLVSDCGQVLRYDPASGQSQLFAPPVQLSAPPGRIGVDKEGNLFILSAWSDFLYFNTRLGRFDRPAYLPSDVQLSGIDAVHYHRGSDLLYLASYGQGLYIFDHRSGQVLQCKKGHSGLPVSGNYLLCLAAAPDGTAYVGYDGAGLDVLNPFIRQFIPVTRDDSVDSRNLRFVRRIAEDDAGRLLVGTAGSGLVRYTPEQDRFEFFPSLTGLAPTSNFVIELLRSGQELWLGFNGDGLAILDLNTLRLKRRLMAGEGTNALSGGTIWSLLDDGRGRVWVGTREGGISVVGIADQSVQKLTENEVPDFASNGIRCLYADRDGQILAGTESGLFRINPVDMKVRRVFPSGNEAIDAEISVKCLYREAGGLLWVGTNGAGALQLDKDWQVVGRLNTSNGLPNNIVYGFLPQGKKVLWCSTNMGLTRIETGGDQKGFRLRNFDEQNGLQSNEFNTGAYYRMRDGRMVFGGINGLNIFYPDSLETVIRNPRVYLSELKIFENPYRSDTDIAYLNRVQLQPFENAVSIGFNTLGFSLPGRIRFQYRLLGYDKNWINAQNRNYVSYTNLNSGHYVFEVRASLNDGEWNGPVTRLEIDIATPFYRTWWFIVSMAALVIGLVYLFYSYRMRQVREKEQIKLRFTRELADLELKALRAQINPHFLFNSLNSINNFILRNDTEKASRYLVKFSQLVRNILNHSSTSVVSLEEEIQTIELYMLIEGMRFNNQFSYHIEVDQTLNPSVIRIPSMLLQPYVENAIWHGLLHREGEKKISIRIRPEGSDMLCLEIEDNGIGRAAARQLGQKTNQHKSFGMQIGENRIRLLNASGGPAARVEVVDMEENGMATGTRIQIHIPVSMPQEEALPL